VTVYCLRAAKGRHLLVIGGLRWLYWSFLRVRVTAVLVVHATRLNSTRWLPLRGRVGRLGTESVTETTSGALCLYASPMQVAHDLLITSSPQASSRSASGTRHCSSLLACIQTQRSTCSLDAGQCSSCGAKATGDISNRLLGMRHERVMSGAERLLIGCSSFHPSLC
jgi:hypothetical protein